MDNKYSTIQKTAYETYVINSSQNRTALLKVRSVFWVFFLRSPQKL